MDCLTFECSMEFCATGSSSYWLTVSRVPHTHDAAFGTGRLASRRTVMSGPPQATASTAVSAVSCRITVTFLLWVVKCGDGENCPERRRSSHETLGNRPAGRLPDHDAPGHRD